VVLSSCPLSLASILPFGTLKVRREPTERAQLPEMSLTVLSAARNLKVAVHQLLGGKVRNKIQVYAWIGGDRPNDIKAAA
jgi:hypothetical protein